MSSNKMGCGHRNVPATSYGARKDLGEKPPGTSYCRLRVSREESDVREGKPLSGLRTGRRAGAK